HRQFGGIRALEDFVDVLGGATVHVPSVDTVRYQSARLGKRPTSIHDRQQSRYRPVSHLSTRTRQQCIFQRQETSYTTVSGGFNACHNLVGVSCFEHLDRLLRLRSRSIEL